MPHVAKKTVQKTSKLLADHDHDDSAIFQNLAWMRGHEVLKKLDLPEVVALQQLSSTSLNAICQMDQFFQTV